MKQEKDKTACKDNCMYRNLMLREYGAKVLQLSRWIINTAAVDGTCREVCEECNLFGVCDKAKREGCPHKLAKELIGEDI